MESEREELVGVLCSCLDRLHAEKLTLNHALCLFACVYVSVCVLIDWLAQLYSALL